MDPLPFLVPTRWTVCCVVRHPVDVFLPRGLRQPPDVEIPPPDRVAGVAFPAPGLHCPLRHPEPGGASPDAAGCPERILGATRGTSEYGPVCEAEMNQASHRGLNLAAALPYATHCYDSGKNLYGNYIPA